MAPSAAQNETADLTSIKLIKDVGCMGLPLKAIVSDTKSASKLNVEDIETLGWRLLGENTSAGDLWNGGKAEALIRQSAANQESAEAIGRHILTVRKSYMGTTDIDPVRVSKHYELTNGVLDLKNASAQSMDTQLLKVCLYFVTKLPSRSYVKFVGRQEAKPTAYPEVEFFFAEDSDSAPKLEEKRLKEASLLSLLRLLDVKSCFSGADDRSVSELTVERVIRSALSGIFYDGDQSHPTHIISGQKLDAPRILRPLTSFPIPDIAGVRSQNRGVLQPVVIIGEAKVRRRGLGDDEGPSKASPNPRAQMAVAVHPTLILLFLSRYGDHLQKLANTKTVPDDWPRFNEETMVYGIYYDEAAVRIYIHFPQLEVVSKRVVVRFYQILVAGFELSGSQDLMIRWCLAMSLFCVQKHARLISDKLATIVSNYPLNIREDAADVKVAMSQIKAAASA